MSFFEEQISSKENEIALLNILDDYGLEKTEMENTQRAVLNILEDYSQERAYSENIEMALLNMLDDYGSEKIEMENAQRALLNIIDDYTGEKEKVEATNQHLIFVNKELEQFTHAASHDLQEPLRQVISYLQLLEMRYGDKLDKDGKEFIEFAVEGTRRMRSIIIGLLDYTKVNKEMSFEIINLNDLLKGVLRELMNQINENNAIITLESLPEIYGDRELMEQLFQNLISNAIKFKSEKNPEIVISGEESGNEYLFSVKDNGIGIKKEHAGKLFTIFQRLNSKEQYPGTGLGLAICKKIVEKHGGKIWFDSEFGKGTVFYFTINKKQLLHEQLPA